MLARLRTLSALAVAVTFMVSGLTLCPCDPPAESSAHDCCAAETAWRAAGNDCCTAGAEAPSAIATSTADDVVALPADGSVAHAVPAAVTSIRSVPTLTAFASPPPLVLRV
jgi:hypothetical protein